MPHSSASRRRRRKAKQTNKKTTTLTLTAISNPHSSPNVQLQGEAVSETHIKMEGSLNSTLQVNQKPESLSEDKELVVPDGYISITREILDSSKMEETQELPESFVDLLENILSSFNDCIDTTKAAQVEEEKNVLSSVVTDRLVRESEEPNEDIASKETLDTTSIPKSDENYDKAVGGTEALPKGAEKSGVLLDVPLPYYPDEVLRSIENSTIVSVTKRRHYTSWRSCCGLFEILRHDDR